MKVIDLDWIYENGVYSLKNEASKDDVIITKDFLAYGYPNYDEEKRQIRYVRPLLADRCHHSGASAGGEFCRRHRRPQ